MSDKVAVLTYISQQAKPVSIRKIKEAVQFSVSERTVRRWLNSAATEGIVVIQGAKRTTTYRSSSLSRESTPFKFLQNKSIALQEQTLKLLRDFWTHNSTAIEGNTLTLGDTQFILDEGLTVSGKPIKEHQEIIGHASAIELIYKMLATGVTSESFFNLHKAVQSEIIHDIDKPYGAWKVELNGTRIIDTNGKPIYLEYAKPKHVEVLMQQVINFMNNNDCVDTVTSAINQYAKIHIAIAHIHPFWDGNGRIARLIANIPLLKAGYPPIVIPYDRRREYIQLLADYELSVGQLTDETGVWPELDQLIGFKHFCEECYQETLNIINIG